MTQRHHSRPSAERRAQDSSIFNRREDSFRARLNAPVSVMVEDLGGNRVAAGTGNLKDLSLRGAMITDIKLNDGVELELGVNYILKFRLMAGPLAGMEGSAEPVRYAEDINGLGLRLPDGFRLPLI